MEYNYNREHDSKNVIKCVIKWEHKLTHKINRIIIFVEQKRVPDGFRSLKI